MCPISNRIFIFLICIYLSVAACCYEPQFGLDESSYKKLSEIPYAIGLKFIDSEIGKNWYYSIVKGKLILKKISPFPPSSLIQIPWIHFRKDVPNGLPVIDGHSYYGSYRLSHDNTTFALSISPNNYLVPREFVLIRSSTKEILFQRKSNELLSVQNIAWSPDSNLLAILDSSSKKKFGFMSIISAVAGHPITVKTFYLSIYHREGFLLVTTEIASGIVGAGQVFWADK